MKETFDEQLDRLKWLADGGDDSGSGPGPADRAAIRAVLDQRDRLRAALDRVWNRGLVPRADYQEAIRPETPAEESE